MLMRLLDDLSNRISSHVGSIRRLGDTVSNALDSAFGGFGRLDRKLEEEALRDEFMYNQSAANQAMQFEKGESRINRDWQTAANKLAMDFEHDEAEINRNWQEYMSNSAYQRAVSDMKAAGINPILAASNGGAAVTAGAMASGVSSSGSSARGQSYSVNRRSLTTASSAIKDVFDVVSTVSSSANNARTFSSDIVGIVSKIAMLAMA